MIERVENEDNTIHKENAGQSADGVRTSSVSYIRRVDEVSWLYFSYTKMRRQ